VFILIYFGSVWHCTDGKAAAAPTAVSNPEYFAAKSSSKPPAGHGYYNDPPAASVSRNNSCFNESRV